MEDENCHHEALRRRCNEKRSREPAPREAASHRDAAVRATAATSAAVLGRRETLVAPERRFHRRWADGEGEGDADVGAEGECRKRWWWGWGWGLGFGAPRRACCAMRDGNCSSFLRMVNPPG